MNPDNLAYCTTEFNGIVFDNWTPGEKMAAQKRETDAADEFLLYLEWLRS